MSEPASPPSVPPALIRVAAAGPSATAGRTIAVVAYAGGVSWPGGYGATVFDMAGMELPPVVPLLADHTNTLAGLVGQGRPTVEGGRLLVRGQLGGGESADHAAALLAEGVQVQASVGVLPLSLPRCVRPNDTVVVNGRTLTAGPLGLELIDRSRLMEVSLVAVAGDPSTSVTITAGGLPVTVAAAPIQAAVVIPPVPATPPQTQHPAVIAATADPVQAERQRVGEIIRLTAGHPAIRDEAIRAGWSADHAENAALKAGLPVAGPAFNPHSPGLSGDGLSARHLSAAILVRAGRSAAAEAAYGAGVMNGLGRLRSASLPDLCAAALQIDRRDVPHSRSEMIRAAVSTGSMPSALGDAARVTLQAAYQEQPATWAAWCAVRPAEDFKTHRTVRPNFFGDLQPLAPGGDIKHGTYAATDAITWKVDTFAKTLQLDRQTLINDDLGAFAEVLPTFGRTASRGVSDLVYQTVLANPGGFFAGGNANLLTGGGSALGVAGMAAAVKSMRTHRNAEGADLDILPAVLVVPPELETVARQILNSDHVARHGTSDQQPTGNPFSKAVQLAVEPRLSNGRFPGASATAWYLFAGPADVPGVVGFLDGKAAPTVETFGFDHDVNTLAAAYRVYFDYGFSLGETVATMKSAGA